MNQLEHQIESLLFIAGKPLSTRKLADMLHAKTSEIKNAADVLLERYKEENKGIHVMRVDDNYQMATSPAQADLVETFIKSEQTGELTKPSLETLTIIAYRGPIAKTELEQIRGVNCSLILRNLLIRGLIEASFDRKFKITVYQVTLKFLEFLGVSTTRDLPEYEKLHNDARLRELLTQDTKAVQTEAMSQNTQDAPETDDDDEEEDDEDDEDDDE
ncbi:MAG: SMC-Scp complex subunit ScpB [Patescibacteria group bacterium]|jgi:segregation and condensation protein B